MQLPEIKAAVAAVRNVQGIPFIEKFTNHAPHFDLFDWLQHHFCFQKVNVANQREHLIPLLANVHIRKSNKLANTFIRWRFRRADEEILQELYRMVQILGEDEQHKDKWRNLHVMVVDVDLVKGLDLHMTSVVMHQPRAEIAGPSLLKVQGTRKYWTSVVMKDAAHLKSKATMYGYYSGMFQAGRSIWNDQGPKGLYAGYWSTLARDVPFAGLMVMCYEALKDFTEYGRQKWFPNSSFHVNSSFEGLVLGGIAGG